MLGDSVRRRQPRRRVRAPRPEGARRPLWLRWLPIAAAAVLVPFMAGYLIAVHVLFPPADPNVPGIAVPPLSGMQVGEAERALAAVGLGGVEVTELPHPGVRAGTIVAQTPLAGQQLRAGAGVRVAVSAGRPTGRVPDVVGFPLERAHALLTRLGFFVERRYEPSTASPGQVLRVDPQPGVQRDLPATITLTVSELATPDGDEELPADTLPESAAERRP